MPIYEYQCEACGETLEKLQKISDEPLKTCPHCSQDKLQKLVSAAGFQLKGTGWYVTDFRDKGKKTADAKTADSTLKTETAAATESAKEPVKIADTATPAAPKTSE